MLTSPLVKRLVMVAEQLPGEWLAQLAAAIQATTTLDWAHREAQILQSMPQAALRLPVKALLDEWQTTAPEATPASVALALLAAAHTAQVYRQAQSVELVWTGPSSSAVPVRRTDQALLQVIHAAQQRLLIVSFAVYKAQHIMAALAQALARGVQLRICVETPEASEGKITFDTLRAFAPQVLSQAEIYIWPLDQRPVAPNGNHGSLHAKVAVADGQRLLISSANLTEYAMTLNMELGLLVHGGDLPHQVEHHFQRLIELGVLVKA